MRFPHAAFKIGDTATHTTSGQIGTIAGIRRHNETLQYLFDCPIFCQWLTIGKLEVPKFDEEGQLEYKLFDVTLSTMREAELVKVTIHLTDHLAYELRFTLAQLERAKGLHAFLMTVETVTESLLEQLGMEKA
jgi:hypothetical protein